MKKIFVMLALTMGVVSANAQSVDSTAVTNTVAGDVTLYGHLSAAGGW